MAGACAPSSIQGVARRSRYWKGMSRITVIPPKPSAAESLRARGAEMIGATSRVCAEALETTPWSHRLSWKEEQGIGEFLHFYRLPAGTVLFHEGDHDAFVGIVVEGALEIRKSDRAQHEHVVARLGAGKMVGEMSLIDGAPRSATAIAATDVRILVLTRDDFDRMSQQRPELALKYALMIAEAVSQLLRQTTGALVDHLP